MADAPSALEQAKHKQQLRRELRARRQALSPTQQQQAALLSLRQLMKLPQFMRANHIALYIANDGELDPSAIAQQLWKMDKQVYLPVLRPDKSKVLWFVEFTANSQLSPNRYGILEPDHRRARKLLPNLLDLVLLPLVGFDRTGARLGMGGGYYDSTFAFKHKSPRGRPYLVGLAHSCQELDSLSTDSWDIPLFAIGTDQGLIVV